MTQHQVSGITPRRVFTAGLAGAAVSAALPGASSSSDEGTKRASKRMPVVFLPHGGGPWPFVDVGIGKPEELSALAQYLKSVSGVPTSETQALLVISAHWEEPVPTVMSSANPPMLYDYYGFPPESYSITWPAPGAPALA